MQFYISKKQEAFYFEEQEILHLEQQETLFLEMLRFKLRFGLYLH